MTCRTYAPSVRIGNWYEDIQLEEDTLKDFLERKEKGELLVQRQAGVSGSANTPVTLSTSRDGNVHFGDIVMVVNPAQRDGRIAETVLSSDIPKGTGEAGASAAFTVKPCPRNAFVITSLDGTADGECVRYGQSFRLRLSVGGLYLGSDKQTLFKAAKKSRHQEVCLVQEPTWHTEWHAKAFDPLMRMELEFSPVQANKNVILSHTRTNQNLCLENQFVIGTGYGREFEVSCFSDLDSHKAETCKNHWMLTCSVPGDTVMDMTSNPPQSAVVNNTEQTGETAEQAVPCAE